MAYGYSLESRMSRAAMKSLGTNPKLFPGIFRKIFTIVGAIAESVSPFSSVDLVLSKRPKRYIGLSGLEKAFLGFFESNQRRDSIITHHSDSSESTSNFMEP